MYQISAMPVPELGYGKVSPEMGRGQRGGWRGAWVWRGELSGALWG